MGPDEAGRPQEYLGGHGLRVQINKVKPNTWFQEVSTAPLGEQTTMKLGYTKQISFDNAKKMGEVIGRWAVKHTKAECNAAASRFRGHAKTESDAGGRRSLAQLKKAWRRAKRGQDRQQLAEHQCSSVTGGAGGKGGGEGKAHKKLKQYVKRTPGILGLPRRAAEAADSEYALPSGDSVDVMFCHKGKMIAVEVKSKKSNRDDIRRGIFQCVKYQAVTEATFKDNGKKPDVRSVLVLGGPLPAGLKATRKRLGVEVIENVRPS